LAQHVRQLSAPQLEEFERLLLLGHLHSVALRLETVRGWKESSGKKEQGGNARGADVFTASQEALRLLCTGSSAPPKLRYAYTGTPDCRLHASVINIHMHWNMCNSRTSSLLTLSSSAGSARSAWNWR
jgi:hypothetical protein